MGTVPWFPIGRPREHKTQELHHRPGRLCEIEWARVQQRATKRYQHFVSAPGSSWDDQLKFAPEIAQITPGDFSPRIGQADRGIVPGRSVQCKRQRAGLFQN
ncbi:hypothetical protein MA16_Dca020965 [Dendrobium catenatum]|uniref:Uncharacterized protein n=1 Tax=Dendrobium catenatum TaxID=906689 RepID=A0A2I0VFS1_9ASPA|nr:hypothetical protein MA16_Dca020965 [Dendrobium catenatum]